MSFSTLVILRFLLLGGYLTLSLVTWGFLRGEHHQWVTSPAAFLFSWSGLPNTLLRSFSIVIPEEGFLRLAGLLLVLVIPAYFYLWFQLPIHWARKGRASLYIWYIAFHFVGAFLALLAVDFQAMSPKQTASPGDLLILSLPQALVTLLYLLLDRHLCFSVQAAFATDSPRALRKSAFG